MDKVKPRSFPGLPEATSPLQAKRPKEWTWSKKYCLVFGPGSAAPLLEWIKGPVGMDDNKVKRRKVLTSLCRFSSEDERWHRAECSCGYRGRKSSACSSWGGNNSSSSWGEWWKMGEEKKERESGLVSCLWSERNTKADVASMEESLNTADITKFHRLEDLVENVGLQR